MLQDLFGLHKSLALEIECALLTSDTIDTGNVQILSDTFNVSWCELMSAEVSRYVCWPVAGVAGRARVPDIALWTQRQGDVLQSQKNSCPILVVDGIMSKLGGFGSSYSYSYSCSCSYSYSYSYSYSIQFLPSISVRPCLFPSFYFIQSSCKYTSGRKGQTFFQGSTSRARHLVLWASTTLVHLFRRTANGAM